MLEQGIAVHPVSVGRAPVRAYDGRVLLAIDTSAGTSVAVVDPSTRRVLAERETEDTRRHAEVIGPFLDEALRAAGITPADVTAVVAGMGPGPFTGLRVGIAAARTFAAAREVPFLPLVSHDAVAAGQHGPLVVLTDARRREVAWSAYDADGVRVAGPGLARPAEKKKRKKQIKKSKEEQETHKNHTNKKADRKSVV